MSKLHSQYLGLGRLPSIDHRDRDHLMASYLPMLSDPLIRRRFHKPGPVLDQGAEPACVGFSGKQLLITDPIVIDSPESAMWLYWEAQKNDEWIGEDYAGTSVRGLMKVLQRLGHVTEYLWAFDVEAAVQWLLNIGPVIAGTEWTGTMFTPDQNGFIYFNGRSEGGHAYLLYGADRDYICPDGTVGAVRMINSWGSSWGIAGTAWISFDTLGDLLAANGEIVTAREFGEVPVQPEPGISPVDLDAAFKAGDVVISKYDAAAKNRNLSSHFRNEARNQAIGARAYRDVLKAKLT